ncbi:MAG: neutral zinc metallopeptidase [Armatimonadetes bacterium]|nr:neutral zinc metallopeptidase [Armatimonadota bacterium]
MRWKGREESTNIEDIRGQGFSGGKTAGVGGLGLLVILAIAYFTGTDPRQLIGAVEQQSGKAQGQAGSYTPTAEEQELKEFTAVTLRDTEVVWTKLFQDLGRTYEPPTLVLFSGQVQSACGYASAASGPFYCGGDRKLFIDLSFYDEMKQKLGARGDFAQAYVVAHEVGHHVQNQLGTLDKVHGMQERLSEAEYNALSVRLELQADYYAGVWAHHAQQMAGIDQGDVEEAIEAANAIGDDTLQKKSQGYVVPDAFTHGTSAQRVRWFMKGFESGEVRGGDTFNARSL